MPTEFFQLAEKTPSITTQLQNERTTSERKSNTIDSWRDTMQFGGWTEDTTRSPKAHVTVSLYINQLPVMTIPPNDELADGSALCDGLPAIVVDGPQYDVPRKIYGFDPGVFTPPPCESFPYGGTKEETAEIFKAKLQDVLGMGIVDTTVSGGVETFVLQDAAPGTNMNGTLISGWVGGTVWYGGWKLDSEVYRGHFISISGREGPGMSGGLNPSYEAWELFARVHEDGDHVGGTPFAFHLFLDPTYQENFPWRICVCPYQMAMWVDGVRDDDTSMPHPRSAFVSMPWAPSGYTGHEVFAFVATSIIANFRGHLEWHGSSWFDSGPWSIADFNRMIIPVLRTRIALTPPAVPDRITTSQGMLILDNAYVTSIPNPAIGGIINHRLAGKLWNCCTVSDNYPADTILGTMLNADWIHVGSETYRANYTGGEFWNGVQKASVWWKFDNTEVALSWRHSGLNT